MKADVVCVQKGPRGDERVAPHFSHILTAWQNFPERNDEMNGKMLEEYETPTANQGLISMKEVVLFSWNKTNINAISVNISSFWVFS
jgi:hypothetical protein